MGSGTNRQITIAIYLVFALVILLDRTRGSIAVLRRHRRHASDWSIWYAPPDIRNFTAVVSAASSSSSLSKFLLPKTQSSEGEVDGWKKELERIRSCLRSLKDDDSQKIEGQALASSF